MAPGATARAYGSNFGKLFGLAYLSIGQPSASAVIPANRAIRVAAIVATVNTNPNLRISLTSRAA